MNRKFARKVCVRVRVGDRAYAGGCVLAHCVQWRNRYGASYTTSRFQMWQTESRSDLRRRLASTCECNFKCMHAGAREDPHQPPTPEAAFAAGLAHSGGHI
eukprot:6189094-Pleurochrysis_carterae.AAC.4